MLIFKLYIKLSSGWFTKHVYLPRLNVYVLSGGMWQLDIG